MSSINKKPVCRESPPYGSDTLRVKFTQEMNRCLSVIAKGSSIDIRRMATGAQGNINIEVIAAKIVPVITKP